MLSISYSEYRKCGGVFGSVRRDFMKLLGLELRKAPKRSGNYTFSDMDRQLSAEMREMQKEIRLTRLKTELAKAKEKAAEYLGYEGEEEEPQQNDLMQLMQLIQAFQQNKTTVQPPIGLETASPFPPAPPNPLNSQQLPPLQEQDRVIVNQIVKKLPNNIKTLIQNKLISQPYYTALCQAVWEQINTGKT